MSFFKRFLAGLARDDVLKPALSALLLGLSRLPVQLGFLVFIGLIPLFSWLDSGKNYKSTIRASLVFTVVYTTVTLHWIGLVTLPGFLGTYIVFAFYFLCLFLILNLLWKRFPSLRFLIFILAWIAFEYLQNFGEFRFPWFNIGYALADYLILVQPADIGGIYLISILVIIANVLIYQIRYKTWKFVMFTVLLLLVWAGYGRIRLNSIELVETDLDVSVVQVSIPQDIKWETTYLDSTVELYATYTNKAAESSPDLIIWPESAIPVYLIKTFKYSSYVSRLAAELETDIFTGFPDYELAEKPHPNRFKFYNSAGVFYRTGKISVPYRKIILVPFGERMPFLNLFPVLWNFQFGQANFEFGEKLEFYEVKGYKYSPLICFEIVFPSLSLEMAENNVDFIVNITNDAWFKRSAGTYQHAVMTRFRAIETRKQIYRCANTGYSLIVLPTGRYTDYTELFTRTHISEPLYVTSADSVYSKYLGWFPLLGPAGLILFIIIYLIAFIRTGKR